MAEWAQRVFPNPPEQLVQKILRLGGKVVDQRAAGPRIEFPESWIDKGLFDLSLWSKRGIATSRIKPVMVLTEGNEQTLVVSVTGKSTRTAELQLTKRTLKAISGSPQKSK